LKASLFKNNRFINYISYVSELQSVDIKELTLILKHYRLKISILTMQSFMITLYIKQYQVKIFRPSTNTSNQMRVCLYTVKAGS